MRLHVCFDANGWAQNLAAEGLRKYAPREFGVTTGLLSDAIPSDAKAVYIINLMSCRVVRGKRVATCVASHAWTHAANDPSNWRTRGVNPKRNSDIGRMMVERADAVVCRNKELEAWASRHHRNARYIPAGIDIALWNPTGRRPRNGKLRVGWCGQVNPERSGHFKGYFECWLPLKERCGDRYEFVENTRTAAEALSWPDLCEFFKSIDVFITTATAEGTPGPPFQAAACGCAVISTDVGQVSEWDALREEDLIVPSFGNEQEAEVTIAAIAERLSRLEDSLDLMIVQEAMVVSIDRDFSYRSLAPKTLEFVCGVTL